MRAYHCVNNPKYRHMIVRMNRIAYRPLDRRAARADFG
jgi:hypothetical protein